MSSYSNTILQPNFQEIRQENNTETNKYQLHWLICKIMVY